MPTLFDYLNTDLIHQLDIDIKKKKKFLFGNEKWIMRTENNESRGCYDSMTYSFYFIPEKQKKDEFPKYVITVFLGYSGQYEGKIKKWKTQVDDAIYFTFDSKKMPKTITLWYKLAKNQSKDLFDELSKLDLAKIRAELEQHYLKLEKNQINEMDDMKFLYFNCAKFPWEYENYIDFLQALKLSPKSL